MRIIWFDIDSLRPDHLGCYGYHRPTSPNIDRIAREGVRFENVFASDVPCLPSRTALVSGQFGIHTGVAGHGGTAADLLPEGHDRGFESLLGRTNWIRILREAGLFTATITPFAERHSAWHWYAGFNEVHNTGRMGMERADQVAPVAQEWLTRNGRRPNWLLHVNLWDPHTPYRTPHEFGEPFASYPLPAWLTEEVRSRHWTECGPNSAQEVNGYVADSSVYGGDFPRQPTAIDSMGAARQMFDGYDTGVLYADYYIGRILEHLDQVGVEEHTVVVITADHGESLGELNVYGDHQTADLTTCRVPLIVRWPGITGAQAGRVDRALHYQFDFAASMVEMLGGYPPEHWDAVSFADAFRRGDEAGRPHLVLSQGAWTCQRAVRLAVRSRNYLCIRTWHDGFRPFPPVMLFDVDRDTHEQNNIAGDRPEIVQQALALLEEWQGMMMQSSPHAADPLWSVLREGGPYHTRGRLEEYLERLRSTGRARWADLLQARHG
jgi:arylsulfatase A-like enzyme